MGNLPNSKGPVGNRVDHRESAKRASNGGGTATERGVRRSPNSKTSGVGGPGGRDTTKTPTERSVRRVPNSKRF